MIDIDLITLKKKKKEGYLFLATPQKELASKSNFNFILRFLPEHGCFIQMIPHSPHLHVTIIVIIISWKVDVLNK